MMNFVKGIFFFAVCLVFGYGQMACRKENGATYPPPSPGLKTSQGATILSRLSASNPLFLKLLQASHIDTLLTPQENFTVFAPTDSALRAKGFSAPVSGEAISDSINALLRYHIVEGIFKDSLLYTLPGNAPGVTLYTQSFVDPVNGIGVLPQNIGISFKEKIYLNGNSVNYKNNSILCSNGIIYPVDTVIAPPAQDLYTTIKRQPELTYFSAMIKINDSLTKIANTLIPGRTLDLDSFFLSRNGLIDFGINGPRIQSIFNLVLAPTNQAFVNAGFATIESLRQFALSSPVKAYPVKLARTDSIFYYQFHYIENSKPLPPKLFYNDLKERTAFINGSNYYNQSLLNYIYGISFPDLYFVVSNNTLQVVGRNATANAVAITFKGSLTYNINASNGTIIEIDHLFKYPKNQ